MDMTPGRRTSVGRNSTGKDRAGKDDRGTQGIRRTSHQGRTKSMTPGPAPDIANSNDLDNRHSEDSKRVGIKADHYAQDGPVRAEGTGVGSSKFPCVDSSDKHVKFSEINVNDCGKKNGKDRNALHVVVLVSHILLPLMSSMNLVTGDQLSLLLL